MISRHSKKLDKDAPKLSTSLRAFTPSSAAYESHSGHHFGSYEQV
jgi:hypothetical protein